MRKTDEEFMKLVREKSSTLRKEKRRRRNLMITTLTPLAVCLAVCAILLPIIINNDSISDSSTTQPATITHNEITLGVYAVSVTVEQAEPESTEEISTETTSAAKHKYTEDSDVAQIVEYLENLSVSDVPVDFAEPYEEENVSITVSYSDGNKKNYTLNNDTYIRMDGKWKQINKPTVGITQLLDSLNDR